MQKGIYGKYKIEKADGSKMDPDACYFVLRLDTDKVARKAMRIYAKFCGNNELNKNIIDCLRELEKPQCGCRESHCPHLPFFDRDPIWRHGGS